MRTGDKMKILHFWSKGYHVGDFFYARAQQQMLWEQFGPVEIWEGTCARHNRGDQGVRRQDLLQPADAVIIGGGPLYDLCGLGAGNLFLSEKDLVDCGKPVLVWSAGVDALNGKEATLSLPYIRALHDVAKSAAVRDSATQQWLQQLGYDSVVTGDASHFLTPLRSVQQHSGPVVFSWRHDLCEPRVEAVREWMAWAEARGLEIRMVCLSNGDVESAARLGLPHFYADQDVDAYVRFLGSAAAVLGCRMHAAIVALIQGVPAHCFYATSRIKSWGDDFFTGQWVLPIPELTASRLCALTDMLLSGSTERFEPFTQRVELLRARTEQWLEANLAA